MEYLSLSFHRWGISQDLIELGAELGFTDVTIQTEGGTVDELEEIAERGRSDGYFELLERLGLTLTVWTHEFEDYDGAWGPVALDNDRLWTALSERYEHVLTELLPQMDYLALVVTESQIEVHEPPLVRKLVDVLNEQCRQTDTTLIFRTFVRHPDELDRLGRAIEDFPDDVAVMNKNAPQDFHVRSIHHPLIGNVGDRTEFVEVDFANEYARQEHLVNCFPAEIQRQFEYWTDRGVDGACARVSRLGRGWRQKAAITYHDILNEGEEVNLWTLGRLATGETTGVDEIWTEWATERFGPDAADGVIESLRPTGEVVAEGLCVGTLHFGRTKWNGILPQSKGGVPALRTMRGHWQHAFRARPDPDEIAERFLLVTPFGRKAAHWRFDDAGLETFHATRTGAPDVIASKEAAYEEARELAARSLDRIDAVDEYLEPDEYAYLRFKLEENEFHLAAMCEAELAWLKAASLLHRDHSDENHDRLDVEMKGHLAELERLTPEYDRTCSGIRRGESFELERGEYIDIPGYLYEFKRYWGLDDHEAFAPRY